MRYMKTPLDVIRLKGSIIRDDGQNVFLNDLKPCPFCGHEYAIHEERQGPYVQVHEMFNGMADARVVCSHCHVSTTRATSASLYDADTFENQTRLDAIYGAKQLWNGRAQDLPVDGD